jgi:hypothetical protein
LCPPFSLAGLPSGVLSMIDFSVVLSLVWAQIGQTVYAVLGVGGALVGLFTAVAGVEQVLSIVTGEQARFAKRYERDRRRERSGKRVRDSGDANYEAYRVRRERRGW